MNMACAGLAVSVLCVVSLAVGQEIKRGDVVYESRLDDPNELKSWVKTGEGKVEVVQGRDGQPALLIERPAEMKAGTVAFRLKLPAERIRGCRLSMEATIKAENVATPAYEWNGVKFMLHTVSSAGSQWQHPSKLFGTFDWRPMNFVASVPRDANEAWLCLGVEATTGKAWYQGIRVSVAAVPRARPASRPASQPAYKGHDLPALRGAMIAPKPKEEDLRTFGTDWKANVVRWQLHRPEVNYGAADGKDANAFDAWLDGSLRELDRLLPVCR